VDIRSYKRARPDGRWDAIVVGSGVGGLTTAALLARHGDKRVLVLEQHYTPGGFTLVFRRPGYEWDTGVHYVGEMGEGGALFSLLDQVTGGAVRWARMPECYDRVALGPRTFDLVAGREPFVEALARDFPGQRDAIRAYLRAVLRTSRRCGPYFADRMLPRALSAALGPFLRARFSRMAQRTVEEVLRPLVRDPVLFDVLTAQCGDYGLTPREASFVIHAMVGAHFVDGGYYPVGGPSTIAQAAARVIAEAGGAVYTNAAVERIVIEGGRATGVRMKGGPILSAPVVVSDAGARATFFKLLSARHADATGLTKPLREVGPSSAHLCLYLGFRRSDRELGLEGTNLWIYADGDREEAFARFAQDPEAPIPLAYVSFPSAKDPSFASRYPGRATVVVITFARMEWFERWNRTRWMRRGARYEAFKESLSRRLLEIVLRRLPQLRGCIDHMELSTPLSTRFFTGHESGEMYGLAHTPARFRVPLRAETPIPGLYLTGADLAVCGVGGATIGGAVCAGAILRKDLFSILRRRVFVRRPSALPSVTSPAKTAA
jgi:phytoene dehydrogenase-like protein